MVATIDSLTRYPIKGLSGHSLHSVQLEPGRGFPFDRQFGFARPDSGFDPKDPKPLEKTNFYMLARDSALALLDTEFNDKNGMLNVKSAQQTHQFDITTMEGKKNASVFLKSFLALQGEEMPQLFEASPHRFTDVSVVSTKLMNAVSIINLDSVLEFSKKIGQEVDPRRFRGNIHLADLPAFSELDAVDKHITIGKVRLKIVMRTKRCPATQVNLNTGKRDMKIPKLLQQTFGHMDMGVYAEVLEGGMIAEGDEAVLA